MSYGFTLYDALVQAGCPPKVAREAHERWEEEVQALLGRVATKDDVEHAIALMQAEMRNLTDRIVIRVAVAMSAVLAFVGTLAALISQYVL